MAMLHLKPRSKDIIQRSFQDRGYTSINFQLMFSAILSVKSCEATR